MKKIINGMCVILGFAALGFGMIGIVLPILPTTPFLLLAAVFFAKGSNKFHQWFTSTNLYIKYIECTVKKKEMTAKAKKSVLFMITCLLLIGFVLSPVWYARMLILCILIFHYYYFLVRIKTVEGLDGEEEIKRQDKCEKKRQKEQILLCRMIQIYCKGNHKKKKELCQDCRKLLDYAIERTEKCTFMETKTFCSQCHVHCYKPDMREKIQKVMKYAGPRMIFYHPWIAVSHMSLTLYQKIKKGKENVYE